MLSEDEPRNLDELLAWVAEGRPVDYLFFWGHRPRPDGSLGPSCLSQWWPASFNVEGTAYRSAEHYMMAAKARLFDDADTERRILAAQQPADAKALGRDVRGFDEETWALNICVRIWPARPGGSSWRQAHVTVSGASGSARPTSGAATRAGGGA